MIRCAICGTEAVQPIVPSNDWVHVPHCLSIMSVFMISNSLKLGCFENTKTSTLKDSLRQVRRLGGVLLGV